jgi:tRNA pseudouridine13 synthase
MSAVREREEDDAQGRSPKRTRVDDPAVENLELAPDSMDASGAPPAPSVAAESSALVDDEDILPKSHSLLGAPRHAGSGSGDRLRIRETDVGISEYVGHDIPRIEGIIKQRWLYHYFEVAILMMFAAGLPTSSCARSIWTGMSSISSP